MISGSRWRRKSETRRCTVFRRAVILGRQCFLGWESGTATQESTIGNGEKYIDVRLDTGWDVYQYYVTADGAQQKKIETYQGVYRIYLAAFLILLGASLLYGLWNMRRRNKNKNQ